MGALLPVTTLRRRLLRLYALAWSQPLRLLLALAVIFTISAILYAQSLIDRALIGMQARENEKVHDVANDMRHHLEYLIDDIHYLAGLPSLQAALVANSPGNLDRLAADFANFSGSRQYYDQVRWLDETGHEQVRVNYEDDAPSRVTDEALQDKLARYYFKEASSLEPGAVFISPVDLNVEHGRIEQPLKPTLRIALSLADAQGRKRGIVVLNYRGDRLLAGTGYPSDPPRVALLNPGGYWLVGPDPTATFGFMRQRPDATLARTNPKLWAAISRADRGEHRDDSGWWIWERVHPERSLARGIPATEPEAAGHSGEAVPPAERFWVVLSRLGPDALAGLRWSVGWKIALWLSAIFALFSLLLLRIARKESEILAMNAELAREVDARGRDLRATETRLEATFNQAAVGIAHVAPDGGWLRVNDKLCDIVGYTHDELLKLTFQDITHPDDLKDDLDRVNALLRGDIDSYSMEKRYYRKDGQLVWIDLTVALVRDSDGAPDFFIAVIEDITRRKLAQQDLRDSQERLIEAKRIAGLGHWDWDISTNSHRWSEEIYRIYGRDPALPPAVYPEVREYFTAESWAALTERVERALATGSAYEIDAEVVRADGEHRWVTARGEVVRDSRGEVLALRGTVQDITQRKQTEIALRESQERLRLFIDHAPAALAMFDRDMRYLALSQRWRDDFDIGDREVLGHLHFEVVPDISDYWKNIYARGLAGEHVSNDEDRFERADGSVHWARWRVLPWHAADGGIGGLVMFSEDITDRVLARHRIEQLNATLEQRVERRTSELTAANRELDAFTYAVSHDLRAPLRAMSGFSNALIEDYGETLDAEAREYLNQIDIAARNMGELINALLVLSRSTRGDRAVGRLDLTAFAQRRLDELALQEPDRHVETELESGLALHGDPRMLEAAMGNLLDNAWKYTSKTDKARIRLYSEEHEGRTWVCVADNGAGFDMEHADKLFQPFQRLHRQDEFKGIGIGLATVQRIVHRHGGEIRAQSEPGVGATFSIHLPEESS
ncbi:MAG: PAS domain S-box protein [Gammaproteobacteria bacterium]